MVSKHNVVDNYLNMTYIYTTYSAIFYLKLKDLWIVLAELIDQRK